MPEDKQWYTNKDLFELITGVQKDFSDLRTEMRETRYMIQKYNGLREELSEVKRDLGKELNEVKGEVKEIKSIQKGKSVVSKGIKDWGGWVFALISLLILLSKSL